jgi:hypothetical protein
MMPNEIRRPRRELSMVFHDLVPKSGTCSQGTYENKKRNRMRERNGNENEAKNKIKGENENKNESESQNES